jgi:hypothetical protein
MAAHSSTASRLARLRDGSPATEQVFLGEDAADATEFLQGTGMARLLFEGAHADTERKAIDAVRGVLETHKQPEGIWLGSAAWLVAATRV